VEIKSLKPHRMILSHNDEIGRIYVPNSKIRVPNVKYPYIVKTNAQGFRSNSDFIIKKNPNVKRILFLGDSNTAGDNVNNEYRFSDLVQQNLGFECYNFAVGGTGVDQHLLIYEKFAHNFEHDILVICPSLCDIARNMMKNRVEKDRTSGRNILVHKPFFRNDKGQLTLCNVPVPKPELVNGEVFQDIKEEQFKVNPIFWNILNNYTPNMIKKLALKYHKKPLYKGFNNEKTREWVLTQAIIDRLINKASTKTIILMPLPETRIYLNPNYQVLFQKFSNIYDFVSFVDVEKYFMEYSEEKREEFRYEYGHYSPKGHEVISSALIDVFKNMNKKI